ncbi:MAG: ABC transporter substrate-binding protein [Spirochaetaceae bacterium]|jgi:peptide/nickel transport system substrate-binding protein|nr:ABC transporter substrate-binding protein [Spirochaetaceae bacterium]
MKKLLLIVLVLVLAMSMIFAGGQQGGGAASAAAGDPSVTGVFPRNESLYFNGILWDKVNSMNPYSVGGVTIFIDGVNARQAVFETLMVYDILSGTLKPQLADSATWDSGLQNMTVKLSPNAAWWDGSKVTADDVKNSFDLQKKYVTGYTGTVSYVESVTTQGTDTIVIKAASGSNYNPLQVESLVSQLYITKKADMDALVAQIGADETALGKWANLTGNKMDVQGSGPYQFYFGDETKAMCVRVDSYWGAKAGSRYGKLAAPKYLGHAIYKDNAAGDAAFRAGEVDISQQFISSIWTFPKFGQKGGINTFIPQAPYYLPGVIPAIIFNVQDERLADPAVRRAIAMSLDYNTIGQNAMSGYTAPYEANYMLPVPAEQALIDKASLAQYGWPQDRAAAIAQAKKELDAAGWAVGADGIRAKGGVKLSGLQAECPQGWSDWNASLEVVAATGKELGIDIQTYFPNATVWTQDLQNGSFTIIMNSYGGIGISSPYSRFYGTMNDVGLPPKGTPNPIGNYGRWHSDRANELITQIPTATDAAKLKAIYTELNKIYLQEMPAAGLMYRPGVFHTVNETVWTGFPQMNDGSGVGPQLDIDGYGIKGLYNLTLLK